MGLVSDAAERAAREAAQKAARKAARKASQEAAEQLLSKSVRQAAQDAAAKAAKEFLEDAATAGLSKAAREAAEAAVRRAASRAVYKVAAKRTLRKAAPYVLGGAAVGAYILGNEEIEKQKKACKNTCLPEHWDGFVDLSFQTNPEASDEELAGFDVGYSNVASTAEQPICPEDLDGLPIADRVPQVDGDWCGLKYDEWHDDESKWGWCEKSCDKAIADGLFDKLAAGVDEGTGSDLGSDAQDLGNDIIDDGIDLAEDLTGDLINAGLDGLNNVFPGGFPPDLGLGDLLNSILMFLLVIVAVFALVKAFARKGVNRVM
jgi:hypothetical protein|tara:strand:- start:5169 stop:6122 length:954 start_codon:yes stop_codon:yes gene_type:complete